MKRLKIVIKSISHKKQRYPTVGDYWVDKNGTIHLRVSEFGDIYMQMAVVLHELVEYFLVRKKGIKVKDIDRFDREYEKARRGGRKKAPCGCKIQDEPGEDIHAPYYKQHLIATKIEKMFLKNLGYSWKKYDKLADSLYRAKDIPKHSEN